MWKNLVIIAAFLMAVINVACKEDVEPSAELASSVYINPSDSMVLVKIYEGLRMEQAGLEWNLKQPASWIGVDFDTIQNVVYVKRLNIDKIWIPESLRPQLLPEVGRLEHLSSLRMNSCEFFGALPGELFDCPLEELEIFYNSNRDTEDILPDEIKNVSGTLRILTIENTRMCNIPDGVGELKQLEKLKLSNNLLNGMVPDFMFQLPAKIYLDGNCYTEVNWYDVYYGIKAYKRLPYLIHNCIGGRLPEDMADLKDEIKGYFTPQRTDDLYWE